MLEGPIAKLLGVPVEPHLSVGEGDPLMMIGTVLKPFSVAEPVKTQLVVKGPPGQGVPDGTVSVAVVAEALKLKLPEATGVEPQSIK